jgi:hypothetical protein
VWFRFHGIPHRTGTGFAVLPAPGNKAGSGTLMWSKGLRLADLDLAAGALHLEDAGVTGTLATATGQVDYRIEITGRRFANRMFIGTYTLTAGETTMTGPFRGGIVPAGAPELVNLHPAVTAIGDADKKKDEAQP